jgi:hypothetical protein
MYHVLHWGVVPSLVGAGAAGYVVDPMTVTVTDVAEVVGVLIGTVVPLTGATQ